MVNDGPAYAAAVGLHRQPLQGQPGAVEPGGRQGRRRCAPSCSTPAGPTATPAPRASRPRTRWPSGSPRARHRRGRRGGVLDRADRADATTATCCWPASTRRGRALTADGGAGRRRGDHDHRHGRASRWSWRATAGASAAWPRAPACWRPQLATMLVVLTTDAVVDAEDADRALRAATRVSFDRLDSDGCMSTNDTVTLLASGASGHHPDRGGLHRGADRGPAPTWPCSCSPTPRAPTTTSRSPCCGAATEDEAVEVGRAIARSALFKTAVFGRDPNWGRVLASIGTTAGRLRPGRPRRRDERRLGVPRLDPRRGPRAAST